MLTVSEAAHLLRGHGCSPMYETQQLTSAPVRNVNARSHQGSVHCCSLHPSSYAAGKIWALWFPICAFVVIGFEHCVMNMFLLPAGEWQ